MRSEIKNKEIIEQYILLASLIQLSGVSKVVRVLDKEIFFKLNKAIDKLTEDLTAGEEQNILDEMIVRCANKIISALDTKEHLH